ncbi:MAG: DTW domain-containing protein [Opitutaceae bacterium]|jgi:DTW domain-containing protein YfiP|nr:DTW domain-containing protein [Opitutaceae bacterium]
MARSVVHHGVVRCLRCQIAPRWCICDGLRPLALPFAADVLMHTAETWRPTSTGNLIRRVIPDSIRHVFHHTQLPSREDVCRPDHTLWILHPRGEPLGEPASAPSPTAAPLQVLLIDGTWAQANDMLRHTEGWGRKVSLHMPGASRYRLRSQHRDGHVSTVEALLILLGALGHESAQTTLRLQFELHVYANLLARGRKREAAEFLKDSPLPFAEAMPALLARLAPQPQ